MDQSDASDSETALAIVEKSTPVSVKNVPASREQIVYEKGVQDRQLCRAVSNIMLHTRHINAHLDRRELGYNKALKALTKYESGAPNERAMRDIARKVDNVYNLDGSFLKDLKKVLEDEMMATGAETNDMMGFSALPALPDLQQPRAIKPTLIGMKKPLIGPKTPMKAKAKAAAAAKRKKVTDDDTDKDM